MVPSSVRLRPVALAALLFLPAVARAELPPLLDRELFFGNPEIAGATLSPDGRYIAFLKPWKDVRNVWVKKVGEPYEKGRLGTADPKRLASIALTAPTVRVVTSSEVTDASAAATAGTVRATDVDRRGRHDPPPNQ